MWVKVEKLTTVEELQKADFDWLLGEGYSEKECLGLSYWVTEEGILKKRPIGPKHFVTVAVIIHGRLYNPTAVAVMTDKGDYVNEEVFM